jgi:type IV secretion system protein VirD4
MVIWAFVQNLVQLKEHYAEEWETFIGNSNAIVCFGMMDQFTVEYVSKLMGTRTVRHKTTSTSTSRSTKVRQETMEDVVGRIFGEQPVLEELSGTTTSENTNEQVIAQPLCSPDEVRRLDSENCLVIGRGDPALCRRVAYFRDTTFSAWGRPDPKYKKR